MQWKLFFPSNTNQELFKDRCEVLPNVDLGTQEDFDSLIIEVGSLNSTELQDLRELAGEYGAIID